MRDISDADMGIGPDHNQPPELVGIAKLIARKGELIATASAWLNNVTLESIATQEQCDDLTGFQKQARAMAKEAEAERAKELEPLELQIEAIRAKYVPILTGCRLILDTTNPVLTVGLQRVREAQQRIKAEADRAAAEARAAADRAAADAEAIRRQAERGTLAGSQVNSVAVMDRAEELARDAKAAEQAQAAAAKLKPKAGGSYKSGGLGRSTGLMVVYAYRVTDVGKAVRAFLKFKPVPPELEEAAHAIAKRMHKAKLAQAFDGIEITSSEKARA